jgi:glycosyltransferase involved in cell wall biosynthesis
MKVLHVIPSVSHVHGGPTKAIEQMEKALASMGIEVTTATTNDDGAKRRSDVPIGVLCRTEHASRIYFDKSIERYFVSFGLAKWLREHVREFDMLHLHSLFSFPTTVAARCAYRSGVPYVVRPLGTLDRYSLSARRPIAKRLSIALNESKILARAATVHFTSEREKEDADSLNIAYRAAILPLGIEIPSFPVHLDAVDRDGKHVLFLSRLDPKKNIEALLQAWARIPSALQLRYPLVVAGAGTQAYESKLRCIANELGIAGSVRWMGHISGAEKAKVLQDAALFVLPSFSENFGIAAAEALGAGVPCVLSHGVALARAVADNEVGVACAPEAIEIASAITRLLTDEAMRRAYAKRAHAYALSELSSAMMGERLAALYNEICRTARNR